MRARPEPTQLEDLSDASFLGKQLILPANVRLDWKVIARYKCSSLFGFVGCNEKKKFYNIYTRDGCYKIFLRCAANFARVGHLTIRLWLYSLISDWDGKTCKAQTL